MQLLIAGDLVPTKSNICLFNDADIINLLGEELFLFWNSSDIRIFNLEAPLVDKEDPIDKCGPNLIAPTSSIIGIKALNPALLTLANNHILDQGEQGLKSTMEILKKNNIPFVGIGDNINEAYKPYIIEKEGYKIGVYACAEHEFSIATDNSPGANPFDPLESFDHIENLKNECDYVIVLYHGGKEHYRYPSPYLQKICRKISLKGADLIVCQHSHCIGCIEKYGNSTIIYGQGNFLFDLSDSEFWKTSLLIKVKINDGVNIEYIPIVKNDNCIRIATVQAAEDILNAFHQRSKEILNDKFIEQKYKDHAQANILYYLRMSSGLGKWILKIDHYLLKSTIIKHIYSEKKLLAMQNYIECESHRELLLNGIKSKRMN